MVAKTKRLIFNGFLCLLVLTLLMLSVQQGSVYADKSNSTNNQNDSQTYNACVINVPQIATDQTKFPDVSINMRMIDSRFDPVPSLLNSDLQIQENNSTPVYSTSVTPGREAGADFYFVVDFGNHTDRMVAIKTLEAFYKIMIDGSDSFTIISNEDSYYYYVAQNINSKEKLVEIISEIPVDKNPNFYTMYKAVSQAFIDADANRFSCSRPLFIVIITGDLSFESPTSRGFDYTADLNKSSAKILFVHSGASTHQEYKNFATNADGKYIDIPGYDQLTELDRLITEISPYRATYNVVYHTNNGGSGNHQLTMYYQGQQINTLGTNFYSIPLEQPSIVIAPQDTSLTRTATKKTEEGYIFNKNNENLNITIDWKGYPREILSAKLIIDNGTPIDVKPEKVTDSEYRVAWDISTFNQKGSFQPRITLLLTDELGEGIEERTMVGDTTLQIINSVPVSLMTTYLLYGLYALVAALVVVFLIWRKQITAGIVKGGKSVGDVIRKTLVGSRNTHKIPYASLQILDGPPTLIGKELLIYSESINLGRDPSKSDLTFYGPDSLTSVSGLHCKLQRFGGGWQLTALSTSGSETFIDEMAIPFFKPFGINDGQRIRMGNLAQQPVECIFHVKETADVPSNDPRKTNTMASGPRGMNRGAIVPNLDGFGNVPPPPPIVPGQMTPPPISPVRMDPPIDDDEDPFKDFR